MVTDNNIFDEGLGAYDQTKYYKIKPFNWYIAKTSDIIRMDVSNYVSSIQSNYLYFHIINIGEYEIITIPFNKPNSIYTFPLHNYINGDDIFNHGIIKCRLELMTKVPLYKWVIYKIKNILNV